MTIAQLPLGNPSFERLRKSNQIYVDKTTLIFQLAQDTSGSYFLARPRRFGKSLLISTFESLFRYGLRDFHGLAIEKLWLRQPTYPVLRLDFSNFQTAETKEEILEGFDRMLSFACDEAGLEVPEADHPLSKLAKILVREGTGNLVLLVDEYDATLTHHIHNPAVFQLHRNFLEEFFSILKTGAKYLRFLFLTGITTFSHTGIFSALNNLSDISWNPAYAALVGYTEEEVETYFASYLKQAEEDLKLPHEALMNQLRAEYDGYCFSENGETRVYNPWSVLSFLANPKRGFVDYWYKSGGQPAALLNYLTSHQLSNPESFFEDRLVSIDDLDGSQEYNQLKEEILLVQTGYLTIGHVEDGGAYLRYPNQEVAHSLAKLYTRKLLNGALPQTFGFTRVAETFSSGSVDEVVTLFNKAICGLTYGGRVFERESQCCAALALLLTGADLNPVMERHNQYGRSDLEVNVGNRHWVFEFKFARESSQEESLLSEAIDQIQRQHYGESDLLPCQLIRVAVVYSANQKRITKWKMVN